jgi:Ser/Thr protein kinase RdoA (MazF antagonist)
LPTEPTPIRLTNNAVFQVAADSRRFALRVHRPAYRSLAHTRSELQFLEVIHRQLGRTRIRVPQPIRTRSGDLMVEVPVGPGETRHCDLLSWIDGRVLRFSEGLDPGAAHLLGEALARIHVVAEQFEPPRGFDLPWWDAEAMFTSASPFAPGRLEEVVSSADWSLLQDLAERTREAFEGIARTSGASGIIHADFILGNCHFARRAGRQEVGILDFDDLGWGYFVYDLCPLLGNLTDYPNHVTLRRAFLAGYRTVRRLPRACEVHLPVLMAARHATVIAWVVGIHRTNGSGPPVAEHVAYRMRQIRDCLAPAD